MGITVKSINKNGNKIIDYVCERDGAELRLSRDELVDQINNKEVENARIQIYKGQIIIRVNTNKTSETSKTKSNKIKEGSNWENSSVVFSRIAKEFKIDNIEAYSRFFFENNPSMKNRLYTDQNVEDKVTDMREMVRFCRIVALRQINEQYEKYNKDLDEVEFTTYCIKNNIEFKEE